MSVNVNSLSRIFESTKIDEDIADSSVSGESERLSENSELTPTLSVKKGAKIVNPKTGVAIVTTSNSNNNIKNENSEVESSSSIIPPRRSFLIVIANAVAVFSTQTAGDPELLHEASCNRQTKTEHRGT